MKISVVIATIGRDCLKTCLDHLSDANEIILARNMNVVDGINSAYKEATGDFIFYTSERIIHKKGWRDKLETTFKDINNNGLISWYENIAIAGVMNREYIEKECGGYIYWPEYIHYWPDFENGEVARKKRKYKEILDFIEIIDKPVGEKDVNKHNKEALVWDKTLFDDRSNLGFPLEFTRDMFERKKLLPEFDKLPVIEKL